MITFFPVVCISLLHGKSSKMKENRLKDIYEMENENEEIEDEQCSIK